MASIFIGHVKHTPRLFTGAKCNVLKLVLVIDESRGQSVPVVVFGAKSDTYVTQIAAGDILRACGTMKENHFDDAIVNELHIGDYGVGYLKKIGERHTEEFSDTMSDELLPPPIFFPDPTDEECDYYTSERSESFPRTGNNSINPD